MWARISFALGLPLVSLCLLLISSPAVHAKANSSIYSSPDAPCLSLSAAGTATNGPTWGRTILSGHNAPGGWFGVDVCSNGVNSSPYAGSDVSCDHIPANWPATGCAPGAPTRDAFGLTFQCPELIVRFAAWAYGDSPAEWGRASGGNAPDLWLSGNHPADFVAYANGSSHAPVPGDILVWGSLDSHGQPWPSGPNGYHDGHVAVVAAVLNGTVMTAEQNVKWGNADHPSDTLALTYTGSGWIVSGSAAHETTLPAYRWQRSMGTTRATYGWLHSVRNSGVFPSASRAAATPTTPAPARTATPTPTPTPTSSPTPLPSPTATSSSSQASPSSQAPVDLPSLAPAVVVTGGGTLSDLAWSDPGSNALAQGTPIASVRSLASPANAALVSDQNPAIVSLASGSRYVFAVGQDGHLYQARTDPGLAGVAWSNLGAPDNVLLSPSPVATMYAGGMAVAARAVDGSLWWRAGAPGGLGAWMPVGGPADMRFASSIVLTGAPGDGSPLLLGLGADGRLYEREWSYTGSTQNGPVPQPSWTAPRPVATLPSGVRLIGHLAMITELTADQSSVGDWSDAPIDLLSLDTRGALWRIRCASLTSDWTVTRVAAGDGMPRRLLSAVLVTSSAGNAKTSETGSFVHVYVAETSATYRYIMPIVAPSGAGDHQLSHDVLPALAGAASDVAGAALALDQGQSALIVPFGHTVGALATSTAMSILGAGTSYGVQVSTGLTALGAVPQVAVFSDTFIGGPPDARWLALATDQKTLTTAVGAELVAPAGGDAGLLESVASPEMTLVVHAEVGSTAKDTVAGIRYTFGSEWAAIQLSGDGRVQLCLADAAAPVCSAAINIPADQHGAWLKLSLHDGIVTGWESPDDTTWAEVDSPQHNPSAASQTSAATPTASPTSPALVQPGETLLRYTQLEVFVHGISQDSAIFHDFVVDLGQGR